MPTDHRYPQSDASRLMASMCNTAVLNNLLHSAVLFGASMCVKPAEYTHSTSSRKGLSRRTTRDRPFVSIARLLAVLTAGLTVEFFLEGYGNKCTRQRHAVANGLATFGGCFLLGGWGLLGINALQVKRAGFNERGNE